MKNLGLRSGMQLLGVVAGIWSYARAELQSHLRAPSWRGNRAADHPERGDVPGWVMITLMSAVLVAALLALAGPALETMFNQAMDKVGN
jgi:type VI protein secretion system component VasF